MKSWIQILILLVLCSHNSWGTAQTQIDQHLFRSIAHEFLMQLGDSTSRILPVEQVGERYQVRFQDSFAFEPSALVYAAQKVLRSQNRNADSFLIEVEQCNLPLVHHSFIAKLSESWLDEPCRERGLPTRCYTFYFTRLSSHEPAGVEEQKESTGWVIASSLFILTLGFVWYQSRKHGEVKRSKNLISLGTYSFDRKGMKLAYADEQIELSSKESDLLCLFSANENITLEREQILREVWGDKGNYVGRTLDVFVSKLRKKLEKDDKVKIINIRGVGYRFVVE